MSLRPKAEYFVTFTGLSESCRVFDYNRDTKTFTASPRAAGLAAITQLGDKTVFSILGTDVMIVDATGAISVGEFAERAATAYPRLEFVRQLTEVPEVVAAISRSGRFFARDMTEADALPPGNDRIEFYGKVAFSQLGLIASNLEESDLLVDDSYDLIAAENPPESESNIAAS